MEDCSFFTEILEHISDGVYFVDPTRTIQYWNRAAREITGYSAREIVGKRCQDTPLNHVDLEGKPLCSMGCPLFQTLSDGVARTDQVLVRHKKGYRVPIQVTTFPIRREGAIVGAAEIFSQNTPTVYEDDLIGRLSDLAMHDALTQLPNRRHMEGFLDYKLQLAHRFHHNVAVLFADVDNFSSFNNTYGHEAGDAVLQNIAYTLRRSIRKDDMVARWGGEEFLGVYSVTQPEHAKIVAEKFRALVESTAVVSRGHTLHTTASIGVTLVQPEDDADSVVRRADMLMYRSKTDGKNRVTVG